jgi:hypothetical protein
MASGSHDTLVQRLAMMLVKLNQGERAGVGAYFRRMTVLITSQSLKFTEIYGHRIFHICLAN